jgi:hypothetical protein
VGLAVALAAAVVIVALRAPGLLGGAPEGQPAAEAIPPFQRHAPADVFLHIHALVTTPEAPGFLYVGTHTGLVGGFNRSDFDYEWYYLNAERIEITGLIIDPTQPYVLYTFGHPTLDEETGIRRSLDRGRTWQFVATRPDPHEWVESTVNPNVMYATDFPTNVLVRSDDRGASWRVLGSPGRVFSVAIDPLEPLKILAGTDVGLFRSANGGESWEPLEGLVADVAVTAVAIDPLDPNIVYAGVSAAVMRSTDAGRSWTPLPGITTTEPVRYIGIDPLHGEVVYAASLDQIFKSLDRGVSWVLIRGVDTR